MILKGDYRPSVGHFEENLPLSVILCFGGEAKAVHGKMPVVLPGKHSAISKNHVANRGFNSGAIGGFHSKEATHGKKGRHWSGHG
jgi:hypothetical protein